MKFCPYCGEKLVKDTFKFCPECGSRLESEYGIKLENCKACNGTGQILEISHTFLGQFENIRKCKACNGTGKIINKVR